MAKSTRTILKEKNEQKRQIRRHFDDLFRDIKDLVRPDTSPFENPSKEDTEIGEEKYCEQFDGTAPWANNTLANGLASSLVSSSSRWFGLQLEDVARPNKDQKQLLENITDRTYKVFSLPKSCFGTSTHEAFLDVGAFGTSVMFVVRSTLTNAITYKSVPLGDCYIDENADGEVDSLDRDIRMTKRQILQRFPEKQIPDEILKDKVPMTENYLVVHSVFPRTERDMKRKTKNNKKFASFYWLKDIDAPPLEEGGFDSFPYIVPRWSTIAGERYGRSPAMTCISDIRMLNEMLKEILINAQLSNGPPIVAEDEGLLPDVDFGPRSLIWKEPGTEDPHVLNVTGVPSLMLQLIQDARNHISRCFFVDFLRQEFKKERQTAFEVADKRDEMLRLMNPMLERLQKEMLSKLIERTIDLMKEGNEFKGLEGFDLSRLKIVFQSPATMAQKAIKSLDMQRLLNEVLPLSELFPEIKAKIDGSKLADFIFDNRGFPAETLRTDEEVREMQQAEAEQQLTQQALDAAPAAASAAKDFAIAKEKGGLDIL